MRYRFPGLVLLAVAPSSPVSAADAYVKAPPMPLSIFTWSGCYGGANLGASAASSKQSATTPAYTTGDNFNFPFGFPDGSLNADRMRNASFIGGAQIGCRYQTPSRYVFGLEVDADFADHDFTRVLGGGNFTAPFLPGDRFSAHNEWQASLRGNVGYTWDRWLAYVTGGFAFAKMKMTANYAAGNGGGPVTFISTSGSDEKTLYGLTIGAGAAYAIDTHWSVGAEYRYTNYGGKNFKLGTITSDSADPATRAVIGVTSKSDLETHQILAKLNYTFDAFRREATRSPLQAFAAVEPLANGPRLYGSVDYVLWQVKGAPLSVPLASTGPIKTTHHGLLGTPAENGADSTILYGAPQSPAQGGNDTQNFPLFSGARVALGYWLDDARRVALEGSAFGLQTRSAGYSARSNSTGNPIVGFPVYNNVPYFIGTQTIFAGEDSLPTSLPDDPNRARANGIITGGLSVTNKLSLWGADLSGAFAIYRGASLELSGLAGLKYVRLAEQLNIDGDIQGVSGPYTGQSGTVWDRFHTNNQFYGAMLGLRNRYVIGRWVFDLDTSVALGASNQTISIDGGFTSINFSSGAGKEGVFAQPANEGVYSGTKFAFVPEARTKVGYQLTPAIQLSFGYDVLYLSNVVRPGDQINREIPKGQTFQQARAPDSLTSPSRLYNTTDFFAHGLTLGLTAHY